MKSVLTADYFGIISEYNPSEDWSSYRESFILREMGVDNSERKKAILLSVLGSETYKLIRGC